MRLAYIIGELGNGGQERQLFYLISELKKEKHDVLLIVWNFNKNDNYASHIKDLGIKYIDFSNSQSNIEKIILSRKAILKFKPVIFHSFTFYLNFFAWVITLFKKTKAIGGIRSSMNSCFIVSGRFIAILSSVFPQKKVSNSHKFLKQFNILFLRNYLKKNTYVVTNSLDILKFQVYNFENNVAIKTASIGRIGEEKRIDLLIQVISILVKKGISIKHYHAGKGVLFDSLNEKVILNNLQDHFIFCGEVDDVSEFLSDKSFFIHTSDFEGFPNVVMEAMACGKAVIATDSGDTSYLVKDNVNGYLVPCGDKETIIDRCIRLIQNPELAKEMGIKGREIAERDFQLRHLMENTLEMYKKIGALK